MKKLTAILLTAILVLSVSITVLADGTTTLTTTVPAATYTLNIPRDHGITFGEERYNIGKVTVTDSQGFAMGKDVKVTITYDAFSCDSVSTTVPYTLIKYKSYGGDHVIKSGDSIIFKGQADGTVAEYVENMDALYMTVSSYSWGKALAGEYSTTITFTSEVVSSGN